VNGKRGLRKIMARIDKRELTRIEIVRTSLGFFLEEGYSKTPIKRICRELGMSSGNITFYFPAKEHLLAELVMLLCSFQEKTAKKAGEENNDDPVFAICLELATMVAMCEYNEVARDIFLSAYTNPVCVDLIRKNDAKRAKSFFAKYRPDWDDQQFADAEVLVSGIEYAIMLDAGSPVSADTRAEWGIGSILAIYGVPENVRKENINKILKMDHAAVANAVFDKFKEYVCKENDKKFKKILNGN